tara:strand:+ start:1928 stop:2326 length:399 start_codon:yes stop_codon:yes gene_type:complete
MHLFLFATEFGIVMKRNINYLLMCTFLGLIGLIFINQSVFLHVHKLEDGTTISHAHPFNKLSENSSTNKHNHTNKVFRLIEKLDFIFVFSFLFFLILPISIKRKQKTYDLRTFIPCNIVYFRDRAPPIISFS